MTTLELLQTVKAGKSELTIDARNLSDRDRARIKAMAEGLGLDFSGCRTWILVRDLRGMSIQ